MLLLLVGCLINSELYYARRAELLDQDGDGHISADYPNDGGDDCDDLDASVHPGQAEVPYDGKDDGKDNDCDAGTPDDDLDGDGVGIATDCDDGDASISPNAVEVCDGVDNDCDGVDSCLPTGVVDVSSAPLTFWLDSDEDTATGITQATLDHNGDSLDDLLIGSPLADGQAGRVDLVTGLDELAWGNHDLDEVARLTVLGTGGPGLLGSSLAQSCDFDGDGFDDPIISANGDGDGEVYGYRGGPIGPSGLVGLEDATWHFMPVDAGGSFGTDIACAQLNDDIPADLIIGQYLSTAPTDSGGRVWIFSGQTGEVLPERSTADADLLIEMGATEGAEFGAGLGAVGDLSGDGVTELGLSSTNCEKGAGCVWIASTLGQYMATGSQTFLTTDDLDGVIMGTGTQSLGTTVRPAGDQDGDGYDDLLLASRDDNHGTYAAWLFTGIGSAGSLALTTDDATASWDLVYAGEQLGGELDGGVDVDGDGVADVLIGEQGFDQGASLGGAALLFLGGPDLSGTLTADDAWASLAGFEAGARAGASVSLLADASGDGLGDLAVGVPTLGSPGGSVALWWGGPRGAN